MKMNQIQIVILGGGYVSIWAYRSLVKHLSKEIRDRKVRIIVVCPEEFHYFHGWTAESLTCIIRDQDRMSPLKEVMPLAKFIQGRAEEIDESRNLVKISLGDGSTQQIQYDQLLIGTGSKDNTEVNGINQHAFQIKSHQELQQTWLNL
jgi:NADH dehydrogenase